MVESRINDYTYAFNISVDYSLAMQVLKTLCNVQTLHKALKNGSQIGDIKGGSPKAHNLCRELA